MVMPQTRLREKLERFMSPTVPDMTTEVRVPCPVCDGALKMIQSSLTGRGTASCATCGQVSISIDNPLFRMKKGNKMVRSLVILDQPILTVDVPTVNGNLYSKETVEKAIIKLGERTIYGQLGMPDFSSEKTALSISLEKLSHEVSDLRIENGQVLGTVKILKTPAGEILEGILKDSCFRMASICNIHKENPDDPNSVTIVTDMEIVSINAIPKEQG